MTSKQRKFLSMAAIGVSGAAVWASSRKLSEGYKHNYRPSGMPKFRAAEAVEVPKLFTGLAADAALLYAFFTKNPDRGERALRLGAKLAATTAALSVAQQQLTSAYIASPKVDPVPFCRGAWGQRDMWGRPTR